MEDVKTIKTNKAASLIDLGDGVACLAFHTPAAGEGLAELISASVEEVEKNWRGLVIGHEGNDFCIGADLPWLLAKSEKKQWADIEASTQSFQSALQKLKYCKKPVVAAPKGKAIGRGACILMHSSHVQAAAGTVIGLPEMMVGLVPASGGIKELTVRSMGHLPQGLSVDTLPFFKKVHDTLCKAIVTPNATEAKELGYLKETAEVDVSGNDLLGKAKKTVLFMAEQGFTAPEQKGIKISGTTGYAAMQMNTYFLQQGKFISEYSAFVGDKMAYVISGGNLPANTVVDEQYLLDLERDAFVQLCGEAKTQERIKYLLENGKPLFN